VSDAVAAVGRIADQRFVAPRDLFAKPGDDRLPLVTLAFRLGLVAAQDVAGRTELDLLDKELGLAPRAIDEQRRQGLRSEVIPGAAPLNSQKLGGLAPTIVSQVSHASGPPGPAMLIPDELTQTRSRCSSLCKFRQVFEVTSPGRVRWAMTSSILLIGARGSSGRACGREFATAKVRSECRQGRSVFLVAPGREPFRQPDAAVLLRRLLHRAGNARSL
jgi:hypothetical protein